MKKATPSRRRRIEFRYLQKKANPRKRMRNIQYIPQEEESVTITNQTDSSLHKPSSNQTNVSLDIVKHLFSKQPDNNMCFLRYHYKLCSALSLLDPRDRHNNSFSTSSAPNLPIISTPLPLNSFPSPYLMPLLLVVLASLSLTVCGLIKPFLLNLPSNKLCLMITRQL
jgi:hypothetical protein